MVVMARLAILALLLVGNLAHADRPAIDVARLGASAADVRAIVDRAAANGLPAELLVDKVREGLAKGVPPARIALVVHGLADSLGRARTEALTAAVAAPSKALLKAIVEAHAAGAGTGEVAAVLRGGHDRVRGVQVLTDLAQRGYPVAIAARTVSAIAGHGKNALDHLVGEAERLRSLDAATPGDALDALARADAQGLGLDHAEQLLHRNGNGNSDGPDSDAHGPNRETSGTRGPRSGGVAAPGHGKNQ
jgi:hypothetical protein